MIIDTEKLKEAVDNHFAKIAQEIDENTRNDRIAMKRLTEVETRQMKYNDAIDHVCSLASQFMK
jgi:hypothetical protein